MVRAGAGLYCPGTRVSCRALIRHVEEQRARAALAREHPLALLGGFTRLFTILAPNREWQRAQARVGDFLAALEAIAVGSLVQPPKRFVDLVERFDVKDG